MARAVNHQRATLMADFTTVRDLGTEGAAYTDVELKQAVNQGIVPGPQGARFHPRPGLGFYVINSDILCHIL
jgi:hypothetical protein